jgi:Flp pilus assembly pilin Flp
MLNNRKAQSAVEYAVLITILLGAFLAIGTYFKRGVQGRWKMSVDELGDQYDPRYAITNIQHTLVSEAVTSVMAMNQPTGWWTKRIDMSNAIDTKTGSTTIGAY